MVLFRDDEVRMIATERAARPRWRKRLDLGIKIIVWAGALLILVLIVLSRMGGRSDTMKAGLEQYFAQATGLPARIGYLNYMSFYPVTGADFDDLTLAWPRGSGQGHTGQAVTIGHVTAAIRFWDLLLGRTGFVAVKVDDISVAPGLIDDSPLHINSLAIEPGAKPVLALKGRWRGQDLAAALSLMQRGIAYYPTGSFQVTAGATRIEGTAAHKGRNLELRLKIAAPAPLAAGTLSLDRNKNGLQARLDLQEGKGHINADLVRKTGQPVTGQASGNPGTAQDATHLTAAMFDLASLIPGWPGLKATMSLEGFEALLSQQKNMTAFQSIKTAWTTPPLDGPPLCAAATLLSSTQDAITLSPFIAATATARYGGRVTFYRNGMMPRVELSKTLTGAAPGCAP